MQKTPPHTLRVPLSQTAGDTADGQLALQISSGVEGPPGSRDAVSPASSSGLLSGINGKQAWGPCCFLVLFDQGQENGINSTPSPWGQPPLQNEGVESVYLYIFQKYHILFSNFKKSIMLLVKHKNIKPFFDVT